MLNHKLPFRILFYVWCCCLIACQQQTTQLEQTETEQETGYQVIAIKDGDTIELLKDGKPLRVRLHGIDTPEKNQPFGTRARQFTADLVFGKLVQLEIKDTDRYGRTVGIIYLADGRSLNAELVRAGFAWHYKAYSKDPHLASLEAAARMAKRGLWAGPMPTPPWDFRKTARTKNQVPPAANTQANNANSPASRTGSPSGQVVVCNSKSAGTYHLDRHCRQLKNCKAGLKTVNRQAAWDQGRRACKVCAA